MILPFTDGLVPTSPFDRECAKLADRHYSRRTVGSPQFAYNGRKLVLRDSQGLVLFVWMFPRPELRMDGQVGYNNAIFRNESSRLSSDIILEAEQAAIAKWGPNRAYTYIDPRKVRSVNPGCCFKKAGWIHEKTTGDGKHLLVKQLQ